MDFRRCLYGGRLCVGTTEGGMGPRIREDNEGKGNNIPRLRFAVLGMTCGPGRRRGMDFRLRGKNGGGRRVSVRGTIFRGNVRGVKGGGG